MSETHEMIYTEAQHEREMTRIEVQSKRWFIAFLIVLAMLFATNIAWVVYESQFHDVVVTQDADTWDGGNNYMNGTGEFSYGTRTPDNSDTGEEGVE